jgi:predicted amidophosphoribosyltransferase
LVCRNIHERLYSKIIFGINNYSLGQKYCRRCEVYLYHDGLFCPCCGMQLRLTPSSRRCKEILRKRKAIVGNGWALMDQPLILNKEHFEYALRRK